VRVVPADDFFWSKCGGGHLNVFPRWECTE
jgi:hypothetical protein